MSTLLFMALALLTLQAGGQVPPPAPPENDYHPIPGPFIAFVDAEGTIEDVGVFDNAVQSWAGPTLSAFRLCFQPGGSAMDPGRRWDALRNAADALRRRGAEIVLLEPMSVCDTRPVAPYPKAYVEIRGLIRPSPLPR